MDLQANLLEELPSSITIPSIAGQSFSEAPRNLLPKKSVTFVFQLNAIFILLILLGTNMILLFLLFTLQNDAFKFYTQYHAKDVKPGEELETVIEENVELAGRVIWLFVTEIVANFVLLINIMREMTWGYWPWIVVTLSYTGYICYEMVVGFNGVVHYGFKHATTWFSLNCYAIITISIHQFFRLKWKKIFPVDERPLAVRHRRVSLTEIEISIRHEKKLQMVPSTSKVVVETEDEDEYENEEISVLDRETLEAEEDISEEGEKKSKSLDEDNGKPLINESDASLLLILGPNEERKGKESQESVSLK